MPDNRRTPPRASRPRGRSGPGRVPGSGRAAGAPRGARPAPATEAPAGSVRRPRFTGRAAVLVLVLAVLAISYASSMRAYLQQRGEINGIRDQIALRRASIAGLEKEKQRWQDPAFVRQQARELGYLMPGETAYRVLDENGKPIEQDSRLTDPSTLAKPVPTAWWSTAWQSMELAGNPSKADPTPAAKIAGKSTSGQ